MGEKNTVEHYIMLVLKKFVSTHVPIASNLSFVDAIIVEYMVSILEDVGTSCNDFDFDDYIEMMSAYIPGFEGIGNVLVKEWLFNVATKIQSGKWLDDCDALESTEKKPDHNMRTLQDVSVSSGCDKFSPRSKEKKKNQHPDQNNNTRHFKNVSNRCGGGGGGDWFSAPSVASSVLFPENDTGMKSVFSQDNLKEKSFHPATVAPTKNKNLCKKDYLLEIPDFTECQPEECSAKHKGLLPTPGEEAQPIKMQNPSSDVTINQSNSSAVNNSMESREEMFPAFPKGGPIKRQKSKEKRDAPGMCSFPTGDEAEPQTIKYSDKVDYLREMFPDIPESQLKRCLSKAKSNVEKAVAMILASRNDGSTKALKRKEKEDFETTANCSIDESAERDIQKLMEMFPRLSECRIRDRYSVVGNNCERAMRVIIAEEESRAHGYQGNKFQVHEVSFKKKEYSQQDDVALKREISKKYSYVVDDPEKEHRPVVLVKKEASNKVSDVLDDDNVNNNNNTNCLSCVNSKVEVKPSGNPPVKQNSNPKLNRKQRYR